jgi:hypothetical protein
LAAIDQLGSHRSVLPQQETLNLVDAFVTDDLPIFALNLVFAVCSANALTIKHPPGKMRNVPEGKSL